MRNVGGSAEPGPPIHDRGSNRAASVPGGRHYDDGAGSAAGIDGAPLGCDCSGLVVMLDCCLKDNTRRLEMRGAESCD